MFRKIVWHALVAVSVSLAASAAQAQLVDFTGEGKLAAASPTGLTLVMANGNRQDVKFTKAGEMSVTLKGAGGRAATSIVLGPPSIDITGEISPEQIRVGFVVSFSALLDADGKATAPIAEARMFDGKPNDVGLFPDGEPKGDAKPFLVKGVVKTAKSGKLVLRVPKGDGAPKGEVTATLDTGAKVTFQSNNLALAPLGAAVKVEGVQNGAGGEVGANTIHVQLPAPAASSRKPSRSPRATPPKAEEKPAEKPAPKPAEKPSGEKKEEKTEEAQPEAAPAGKRARRTTPGKIIEVN
jgi:hypothetical protein